MPVWLSLLVAVVATVGFFFGLYAVVIGLVEGKRVQARPRLGIGSGSRPGTFTYWVTWDTNTFNVQIYRLRVSLYNPDGDPKEGVFTVTYDPVIKAPFQQEVEFPPVFAKILESQQAGKRGIITIDFRTVDETTLPVDFSFEKMRRISQGQGAKPPKIANVLPAAKADAAPVMTLDYSELVVRRKKIRDLEAAAKAKAAKAAAAPKPVAAAAGAAVPAPASAVAKAPAAAAPAAKPEAPASAPSAPAPVAAAKPAPEAAPADKPKTEVPSIKAVIAKANAQTKEKG